MDDKLIDLRNSLIEQGTNLFLLARKLTLVTVGAVALAMDSACRLLDAAAERGEVMAARTPPAKAEAGKESTPGDT